MASIFFSKIAIFSGACGALGTKNTTFSTNTPLKTRFFVARLRRAENPFKNGRPGVHLFLSQKSNPENLWGAPIFVQKILRIRWGGIYLGGGIYYYLPGIEGVVLGANHQLANKPMRRETVLREE